VDAITSLIIYRLPHHGMIRRRPDLTKNFFAGWSRLSGLGAVEIVYAWLLAEIFHDSG
jgi:hypothetical protein